MVRKYYTCFGGGAGDIYWEFLRDHTSWWLKTLVEDYCAEIRAYMICHNPGAKDIFRYNPYIKEVVYEDWRLPNPEDTYRFAHPIDGYLPLQQLQYIQQDIGLDIPRHQPLIYLNSSEQAELRSLTSQRPLIVAQPWAGLSDRDAFDSASFEKLVYRLAELEPNCRIIVTGYNHNRGCKYSQEELHFDHPNVINKIDQLGFRLTYHLVNQCDAFVGSHSSLIRIAWDARKRNVCVLPWPHEEKHINSLDPKYTYGWKYPESARFTFPYAIDAPHTERRFDHLDFDGVAQWLVGK